MARLHRRIRRRPIAFAPDIPAKPVEFSCGSTTRTPAHAAIQLRYRGLRAPISNIAACSPRIRRAEARTRHARHVHSVDCQRLFSIDRQGTPCQPLRCTPVWGLLVVRPHRAGTTARIGKDHAGISRITPCRTADNLHARWPLDFLPHIHSLRLVSWLRHRHLRCWQCRYVCPVSAHTVHSSYLYHRQPGSRGLEQATSPVWHVDRHRFSCGNALLGVFLRPSIPFPGRHASAFISEGIHHPHGHHHSVLGH